MRQHRHEWEWDGQDYEAIPGVLESKFDLLGVQHVLEEPLNIVAMLKMLGRHEDLGYLEIPTLLELTRAYLSDTTRGGDKLRRAVFTIRAILEAFETGRGLADTDDTKGDWLDEARMTGEGGAIYRTDGAVISNGLLTHDPDLR